jgi:D-glycero-D-manno-heptose 1,7-bisphosphate phosphatase
VQAQAATAGGRLDAFFVCPHAPADHCHCRKPQPGLLLAAAQQYNLDLSRCVFVGDSLTDMQAAEAAGCMWLLVRTGRQGSQLDAMVASSHDESFFAQVIDDLAAAVKLIAAAGVDRLHFETSFE